MHQIIKEEYVFSAGRELTLFAFFDNLDNPIVEWGSDAILSSPFRYDAVDRINFAGLSFFDILKH